MQRTHLGLLLVLSTLTGCVERRLTVVSDPPGALVYLNNQEVGRTPVTRDFLWYGNYDVQIRKEGYDTLKTHAWITAPWWQWPPIDMAAEVVPMRLEDHQYLGFILQPASTQPADGPAMVARSAEMRAQLQSSEHTRKPAPPTTAPAKP